jgi:hypothetical protein
MEVKKDMTNATTGGTHMATSTSAVGKYKRKPLEKLRWLQQRKLFVICIMVLLWKSCQGHLQSKNKLTRGLKPGNGNLPINKSSAP